MVVNVIVVTLFWAIVALLLGFAIECVFVIAKKIKGANQLRKRQNKERVLYSMTMKEASHV